MSLKRTNGREAAARYQRLAEAPRTKRLKGAGPGQGGV